MDRSASFLTETANVVREVVNPEDREFALHYSEALNAFMALNIPSSGRLIDSYRRLLSSPIAARNKLLFMAAEEACGAAILRYFMQWADGQLLDDLALHAKDEERHAQMLSRAAQNFATTEKRYKNLEVDPRNELVGAKWEDFPKCMWNIHINEIAAYGRYFAMQNLVEEVDSIAAARLGHTLQSLMKDERNHIRYTAKYLESWVISGVLDPDDMRLGIEGYDQLVAEEIERIDRSLSEPDGYPFDRRLVLISD